MLDITIAIPVKNEEENLKKCLDCIGSDFAKEIIVIDSNSTDKTQAIAQSANVTLLNFDWNGLYPKKRNWFLQNYNIQTKWVMFLDADEMLTKEFKVELAKTLKGTNKRGFRLQYSVFFLGKKLKGGYPLRKLAVFQTGLGLYEKIEENYWSNLDMEIHEHLLVEGEIGIIKSKIDHYYDRGISHFLHKHNEYSNWEAYLYYNSINSRNNREKMTIFQKIKYLLIGTSLLSNLYFLGSFFFMKGFLDGKRGYIFAKLKAGYFLNIYCKINELRINNEILNDRQ
ncbi:glycosyltransferase family 2 protein [Siphonobacter sp. SORGH_AS_1065]|uniref:glycosyltransferase family 2 protein n=1 Tax=Siphonobacter sp. SORGH_AS_1065 TaxID=3041795 RepID=UPI002786D52E|nr:glycosyltransferase family 2 protein [Siphonobacter sp. SORGH_AS_1065]MDQ1085593.1 glycosyltransferase involved in cell wall biosynthesis [Siphonobacter sp. SORGH_AS_1065]